MNHRGDRDSRKNHGRKSIQTSFQRRPVYGRGWPRQNEEERRLQTDLARVEGQTGRGPPTFEYLRRVVEAAEETAPLAETWTMLRRSRR